MRVGQLINDVENRVISHMIWLIKELCKQIMVLLHPFFHHDQNRKKSR